MSALKMLRDQRATLNARGNAIMFAVEKEDRLLTDEERAELDKIDGDLGTLDADIARAEKVADRRREMDPQAGLVEFGAQRTGSPSPVAEKRKFASFGEQLMAVARAGLQNGYVDPRLQVGNIGPSGPEAAISGLNEQVGSEGGFLVQTEFAGQLLNETYQVGELLSRIRRIGLGGNSTGLHMYGMDETSRANGSRWGGFQAFWTGEAQQKTASMPRWRNLRMELDKLTALCYSTDELLQDATALENVISEGFRQEFTFKLEDSILNGTGAGQPLGILNSGAVITVAKETSQPNGTIMAANVIKMWSRLSPSATANAVWLVNPDAQTALWQMYTPVTNVAGTENVGGFPLQMGIFTPPGFNGATRATLMGRPVIPCEYCATLGTSGDIVLVDLSQYLAIDKGPMQSASSIHVRFIFDETVFRFVYRYNGMPMQYTPLTPYKGTTTTSPYIVLAAR